MKNKVDVNKCIAVFLEFTFVLLLIPVLYIGKYNYHCADDLGFSAASHVIWEDTHSVWSVLKTAGETVVNRWHIWQGTFTTMYIMALEPGLFGDSFYHFVPWIMIGLMTGTTLFFAYIVLVQVFQCDRTLWISISMIYLIYALERMVDPNQGFFWFNGSTHYMIPHALAIMLASVILLAIRAKKRVVPLLIVSCILAFLIGGSNYITALNTAIAFVLAIGLCIILHKRNVALRMLIPFLCFIPAFLLNVLAPGNSVRQSMHMDHPNPIKAIFLSFYYCTESVTENWLDWSFLTYVAVLIPFCFMIVKAIRETYEQYSFQYPLIVFGFSYCFLSAMFTPTAYAAGTTGGGRVDNIIFLDLLLLVIVNLIYVLGWLDVKVGLLSGRNAGKIIDNRMIQLYLGFIVGFTLFNALLYCKVEPNYFTSISAIHSVLNGEAAAYGEETRLRSQAIEACEGDELSLPRFVNMPYLLYYDDIVADSADWKNESMERYYRINTITAYSVE